MTPGRDEAGEGRRQAWSDYWSQGALHSCIGSFDARYSGAIGGFWDEVAAGIPADARVLDLGTGNGALPLRLWEARERLPGMQVDAVDLASLAPPWYHPGTHAGIEFHSGVEMEALPFADGTFDRVFSQFGLEYANWPDALHECLRVARDGATLAFVMHHAGSVLVGVGRAELENQALLLEPDGLLAAARGVLPWIARMRGGDPSAGSDPEALRAREAYNAAMSRLADAITASTVPDALVEARDRIHRLLAGVDPSSRDAEMAAIDGYGEALASASLRTRELVGHALDERQVLAMTAVFEAAWAGCTSRHVPLVQREGVLAWGVVVGLPGASSTSSN